LGPKPDLTILQRSNHFSHRPRGKTHLRSDGCRALGFRPDMGPIANEGYRRVARIASAAAMNPTIAAQKSLFGIPVISLSGLVVSDLLAIAVAS
jgi:hypothetical protein